MPAAHRLQLRPCAPRRVPNTEASCDRAEPARAEEAGRASVFPQPGSPSAMVTIASNPSVTWPRIITPTRPKSYPRAISAGCFRLDHTRCPGDASRPRAGLRSSRPCRHPRRLPPLPNVFDAAATAQRPRVRIRLSAGEVGRSSFAHEDRMQPCPHQEVRPFQRAIGRGRCRGRTTPPRGRQTTQTRYVVPGFSSRWPYDPTRKADHTIPHGP